MIASMQIAHRGGLLINRIGLRIKSLQTIEKLAIDRFSQIKPVLRYCYSDLDSWGYEVVSQYLFSLFPPSSLCAQL